MPIFKVNDKKLEKISRKPISNEKQLQCLVEDNLEQIFGIRFIATEYPFPNGRVDTLGIDENNTPVVIEYKHKQDLGAITQGLFYVDWIKQNKRTFEMIVREKIGREATVDWSLGVRLIIIAEAFDIKEISAINQVKVNVELLKYAYYGDMMSIEEFAVVKTTQRVENPMEKTEEGEAGVALTLEQRLEKTSDKIRSAFLSLRDNIFNLGDDIVEKLTNTMVCYYSGGKGMAWFNLESKGALTIHLRKGNYNDKNNKITPDGWGGYPYIRLRENEIDINYLKDILIQAYQN